MPVELGRAQGYLNFENSKVKLQTSSAAQNTSQKRQYKVSKLSQSSRGEDLPGLQLSAAAFQAAFVLEVGKTHSIYSGLVTKALEPLVHGSV